MSYVKLFSERLDRFLFFPASAVSLAIFRVAFYFFTFCYALFHMQRSFVGYSPALYEPEGVFKFLGFLPEPSLPNSYYAYFFLLALAAAGLGGAGIRTACALFGVYIFGYRYNFSIFHEPESAIVVCAFVMIFARCSDTLTPFKKVIDLKHSRYGWPIRTFQLYWILMIVSAGLLKLVNGHLEWITGNPLYYFIYRSEYEIYPGHLPTPWVSQFLLEHRSLTHLFGSLSLLSELLMPLVLVNRICRVLLICGFILMLGSAWIIFHVTFLLGWSALIVAWLPLEKASALLILWSHRSTEGSLRQ